MCVYSLYENIGNLFFLFMEKEQPWKKIESWYSKQISPLKGTYLWELNLRLSIKNIIKKLKVKVLFFIWEK